MEFLSLSKNVVYHMQFLEFIFLLQKRGLSYGLSGTSFPSPKMMTIIINSENFIPSPKKRTCICNFKNSFPFFIDVDYHMKFREFLFLLQKHGLSYAVNGISFPSLKTWYTICSFLNFFSFSKNVDYHMEFMKFLFLLQKCGLS